MFKSSNFCHIASNNRNEVKAGVFVYKTTDDLQTVLGRGYFNKKIIDLNLHDLIIHVQENNADKTVVQKNTLCVIGKTLDDVITDVIKSDWQESIEDAITELQHTDANLQAQITTNKNAIDKEITDRTNADNALRGQITANANNIATNTGNIATLRNDVGGLGNQVQGIKAKIPGNATADNQLATKADLATKANTATVNTKLAKKQDKLVSGTNIKTVNNQTLLGGGNVEIGDNSPTGTMISFGGATPPSGYLKCDGAKISRTTYAKLFAVIGTKYGKGDGSTTFNLPDFSGARFVNSANIKNPTVYVGKIGNGNTRIGAHYGNNAGNMSGTYEIIVTTYSGNPAYIRNGTEATAGNDYDTQTYIKSENQLSVAPKMLMCIKY